MQFPVRFALIIGLLMVQAAYAHGPRPFPLQRVPIPPVPGLLDGTSPIVVDKNMAIALGKALFWDMNVGSDGQACGSCHFKAGADSRTINQVNPGFNHNPDPLSQSYELFPTGTVGSLAPTAILTWQLFTQKAARTPATPVWRTILAARTPS